MYKVTLSISEQDMAGYKKRGRWPLQINAHKFDETTVIETDDLMPFAANPKHPFKDKQLYTDPRLKIEVIHANSEETD